MGSVKLGIFHTQILWDLLHDIHFVYDEVELADLVVNKVSEALGAEAGIVFKVDTVQGLQDHCKLYPLASKGVKIEDLQKQHFEIGKV